MTPYTKGTEIIIRNTDRVTPKPAPSIDSHGVVMRWTYNVNTIVLAVGVLGVVYWVPQSDVEVVR